MEHLNLLKISLLMLLFCIFFRIIFKKRKWNYAYEEFDKLYDIGLRSSTPFLYFITIIVFCGGIGMWIAFYQGNYDTSNATTYIFALTSTMLVDVILNINKKKYRNKEFLMFVIFCFVVILAFAGTAIVIEINMFFLKWYIAGTALISSWYLWWILSSDDEKLDELNKDELKDQLLGPDPSVDMTGKGLSEL